PYSVVPDDDNAMIDIPQNRYFDRLASSVFHRVVEKVRDHLLETHRIPFPHHRFAAGEADETSSLIELFPRSLKDISDDGDQIDVAEEELQMPSLEPRRIEKRLDEAVDPCHASVHPLEPAHHSCSKGRRLALRVQQQATSLQLERGQRRSEVVRGHREELF